MSGSWHWLSVAQPQLGIFAEAPSCDLCDLGFLTVWWTQSLLHWSSDTSKQVSQQTKCVLVSCCYGNNMPQTGWKQKSVVLPFWRLEVWNKGVGMAVLLKPLGKSPSSPLPSFWWSPAILHVPCLPTASLQFLPLLSHGLPSSVSVSVCPLLFL